MRYLYELSTHPVNGYMCNLLITPHIDCVFHIVQGVGAERKEILYKALLRGTTLHAHLFEIGPYH